jgi:cysteine desulfurase
VTAYLDHAATTPMLPEAIDAMAQELALAGNPSSLHSAGRRARRVLEESREELAAAIGAAPYDVIFTAGGTESDNQAIKGLFWARSTVEPQRRRVIVSAVEHHAVIDAAEWLGRHEGAVVQYAPVDALGRVDLAALEELLADPRDIALVSVMWANNEVGTVQPVGEVAELAAAAGVPLHSDAIQALGQVPLDFAASGVDALTLSGHKIGGPVGVGALVVRRGLELTPVVHGGGQERGVRSGTVDVASARALAVAASASARDLSEHRAHVQGLRDELVRLVRAAVPDVVLRGDADPDGRLPANAHFTFPGCEGDSLLYLLDARGIECSTGSACQAGVPLPSHVLLAMGIDPLTARGALRFSFGRTSSQADVTAVAEAIGPVVERARRAGIAGSAPARTSRGRTGKSPTAAAVGGGAG